MTLSKGETAEQWMSGATLVRTIGYSYNADSQLTSGSDPDSAYADAFDGEGRVTSVDNNGTPNVPRVAAGDAAAFLAKAVFQA